MCILSAYMLPGASFIKIENVEQAQADFNLNALGVNPTKWSNTLKQFVGNLPTNCLSVFDHFVKLAFKGLSKNLIHI